jgi:dolichol-phosphate mannosyltransferase
VNVRPITVARLVAGVVTLARLARVVRARPPVTPAVGAIATSISVVVPARDEEHRIGPLLEALHTADGVTEVIVVDDESSDGTAALAAGHGVIVVPGRPPPPGWAGKTWALQQGLDAAGGEWIVALDADTRPDPRLPAAAVARARDDGIDLLTLAGRFELPTRPGRWLHAAMLATLVYRFGAPGTTPAPARPIANGQFMVGRRAHLLDGGGLTAVAGQLVEDVALARHGVDAGWNVQFLDAGDLLAVRPYESMAGTWHGWGRSIGLPGIESRPRRLADVAVLALVMPLPQVRLLARRFDFVDALLVAVRLGTLVGTSRAYSRRGAPYWLSPFGDLPAVVAVGLSGIGRRSAWRGRPYDAR